MTHDGWRRLRLTFRLSVRGRQRIERLLAERKLSQSAIARLTGLSKSTINRYAAELARSQDLAAPRRTRSKWKCTGCGAAWYVERCPKCGTRRAA